MAQYRISGGGAEQLAAMLEASIARGDLRPGEALPPVRRMAHELRISPTTVTAALARLRARGLVATRERSGTYVNWRPPVAGPWPLLAVPEGARDLATGNPDPELLPDLSRFLRRMSPAKRLYGADPILPELLELAAAELGAAGIPSKHVTVVGGGLDGIERTVAAQLRPGDVVAVEDPGYPGVIDLCRALGLGLAPVPVDRRGMLADGLERALSGGASAVVVTPRGQNPTGARLDRRRADELRAVLRRHADALLIEDDHLGPIADGPRISLTRGRRRWAATRSVSKSLGPDIRLALLTGDEQTIERVEGRQLLGTQWVSHLLQQLVVDMWSDGEVATLLARARDAYAERRGRFLECLAAEGIAAEATTGLNTWIPVPDEAAAVRQLLQDGWAVSAGAPFRLQAAPAIRVTLSTLDSHDSQRLARDVAAAIRPRRRTRAA